MKISKINIRSFRSIRDQSIDSDGLTIFVGSNGSGKSNFLKALKAFYEPKFKVTSEDFFNREVNRPIEISVTYAFLSDEEKKQFAKYLSADSSLSVIKRFSSPESSGEYFGLLKKSPELAQLERKPATEFKKQFQSLREKTEFSDLADAKNASDIENAILAWEEANPDKLETIESATQFFGFENSSAASLERYTKFVYIPAVMADSHLEDAKGGPIGELADILARHQLKEDAEIKNLEEEIKSRYAARLEPFNLNQMSDLSDGVTHAIQMYYDNVGVSIKLDENVANVSLPTPKAIVNIKESGFDSPVSSAGQGLQRAFVLSLLQYFAENPPQAKEQNQENKAEEEGNNQEELNLILGIDEPELYQHPSKQKLFYKVLNSLTSTGTDLAATIQCFYTTHSPLMVDIERFNNVIRVSKEPCESDALCETRTYKATLDVIAEHEAKLPSRGAEFTALKTLSGLINAIDSRINEGFYSRTCVLVEGASDAVALRAAAQTHPDGPFDLDRLDISIIDCGGKNNIEKPKIVFGSLAIRTYCIWDSDYAKYDEWQRAEEVEKKAALTAGEDTTQLLQTTSSKKGAALSDIKKNRDLLALNNETECDWPEHVGNYSAAHKDNLESTLKEELGEGYLSSKIQEINKSIQAKNSWKNPLVMKLALEEAFKEGKRSQKIDDIIRKIIELNESNLRITES